MNGKIEGVFQQLRDQGIVLLRTKVIPRIKPIQKIVENSAKIKVENEELRAALRHLVQGGKGDAVPAVQRHIDSALSVTHTVEVKPWSEPTDPANGNHVTA